MLNQLRSPTIASYPNGSIELTIPTELSLKHILGRDWLHATKGTTCNIYEAAHASRQLWILFKVITYPLISHDTAFVSFVPFAENRTWVLDVLLELLPVRKKWEQPTDLSLATSFAELTIEIIQSLKGSDSCTGDLRSKAHTVLALICAEMFSRPDDFLLDKDESRGLAIRVCCKAIIFVAHAALEDGVVARLAESSLMRVLALLDAHHSVVGQDADFWVRPAMGGGLKPEAELMEN